MNDTKWIPKIMERVIGDNGGREKYQKEVTFIGYQKMNVHPYICINQEGKRVGYKNVRKIKGNREEKNN